MVTALPPEGLTRALVTALPPVGLTAGLTTELSCAERAALTEMSPAKPPGSPGSAERFKPCQLPRDSERMLPGTGLALSAGVAPGPAGNVWLRACGELVEARGALVGLSRRAGEPRLLLAEALRDTGRNSCGASGVDRLRHVAGHGGGLALLPGSGLFDRLRTKGGIQASELLPQS